MTLHTFYNHRCTRCDAFYIPYDTGVACPNCGLQEDETTPFVARAADSAIFNLRQFGSYVPDAWLVNSYGDHVLHLIFLMLEQHRTSEDGADFRRMARAFVDKAAWQGQEYAKEHVFAVACSVHEELGRRPSRGGRQFIIEDPPRLPDDGQGALSRQLLKQADEEQSLREAFLVYDHRCPTCEAGYIPYDTQVPCPRCGHLEEERFDFVSLAADLALFYLQYGSYLPIGNNRILQQYQSGFVFEAVIRILERHRTRSLDADIATIARSFVEGLNVDDDYVKEHIFALSCRVYDEIVEREMAVVEDAIILRPPTGDAAK